MPQTEENGNAFAASQQCRIGSQRPFVAPAAAARVDA
jgi:hypothetical protein